MRPTPSFLHWLLSLMTMQGFLVILQPKSSISNCQIFLWKKHTHGHVNSLFLFAWCHNPKGKETKTYHVKEQLCHPPRLWISPQDKALRQLWIKDVKFTQGINVTSLTIIESKGIQRWTGHDFQSQRTPSLKWGWRIENYSVICSMQGITGTLERAPNPTKHGRGRLSKEPATVLDALFKINKWSYYLWVQREKASGYSNRWKTWANRAAWDVPETTSNRESRWDWIACERQVQERPHVTQSSPIWVHWKKSKFFCPRNWFFSG